MQEKSRQTGSCETCTFWEQVVDRTYEGYQSEGLCRRRAPAAVPRPDVLHDGRDVDGAQGMFTAWPRTFAESDWCGEWTVVSEYGGRHSLKVVGKP
ncbi:MAG: hypothetical protein EBX37_09475 [Alphaproteobacteria bacterium]|jgi:hypothetical protein|nr:hypothetical protein [Alphaproteobacteria bacterium]